MTLTEQWKKGKLDRDRYYIKYRGNYVSDNWHGDCWEDSWSEYVEEVLAPVPTYEEWQELNKDIDTITELWKQERSQLNEKIQLIGKLTVQVVDLKEENQQLKELLKECRRYVGKCFFDIGIFDRIDNAIGEKK